MVSNYARMLIEIRKEAVRISPDHNIPSESLTSLIMNIVDLEDRNRIKAQHAINQTIRVMIEKAARASDIAEDE